ncbi:MAG: hypothetical protein ACR2GD_05415 [Pyrinomonadaceae bacterium]
MKQRSRKSLKITDAVVRGEKTNYEFEVFPIETEFEPQPAVYIFSRRKLDKTGRGHQKFVRVGQTASLDGDFSKYKKNFASNSRANVICVYVEEEENSRRKIEEELKAAHLISCAGETENLSAQTDAKKTSRLKSSEFAQPKKQIYVQQSSNIKTEKPISENKISKPTLKTKTDKTKAAKPTAEIKIKPAKPALKPAAKKVETKKINKLTSETSQVKKAKAEKSKVGKLKIENLKTKKLKIEKPKVKKIKAAAQRTKTEKPETKVLSPKPKTRKEKIRTAAKIKTTTRIKKPQTASAKTKGNGKNVKPIKNKTPKSLKNEKLKSVKSKPLSNGKKAKENGKTEAAKSRKTSVKKPVAAGKNRAAKQGSRKQLAF